MAMSMMNDTQTCQNSDVPIYSLWSHLRLDNTTQRTGIKRSHTNSLYNTLINVKRNKQRAFLIKYREVSSRSLCAIRNTAIWCAKLTQSIFSVNTHTTRRGFQGRTSGYLYYMCFRVEEEVSSIAHVAHTYLFIPRKVNTNKTAYRLDRAILAKHSKLHYTCDYVLLVNLLSLERAV